MRPSDPVAEPEAATSPDRLAGAPGARLRTGLLIAVVVVLVGGALRVLAPVLMPLAAAVLIALAVMPVRDRVRARVPARLAWLGVLAALVPVLLAIALFAGGLWLAARQAASELPMPAEDVVAMIGGEEAAGGEAPTVAEGAAEGAAEGPVAPDDAAGGGDGAEGPEAGTGSASAQEAGQGGGGLAAGAGGGALKALGERALGAAGGAAGAVLNSALAVVGGLVLVVFLTLLLLAESEDWRQKVEAVASRRTEWRMTESADVIAGKVRAYLLTQAGLGLVSAALYAAWLGIWGIGLLFVWPMLSFLMNFIPSVGSIIAGLLTTAYVLLTQGTGTALAVGAGLVVIEQVMGNLVGPRVQGRSIALSPLVILVSLVFWGWAWGIAGALLAVPMTVATVVLAAHVPALRPWALMLSNRTSMGGLDDATRKG